MKKQKRPFEGLIFKKINIAKINHSDKILGGVEKDNTDTCTSRTTDTIDGIQSGANC